MDLSKPGGDDEFAEEELRRRAEQTGNAGGGLGDADVPDSGDEDVKEAAETASSWFSGGCDSPCDGCDVPDCDCGGCDLLLRLSTVLALVAAVVPPRAGGLVAALIRGYRRWLTRFTPACPSRPSCSAYALDAVQTLGARRGLRAAAARIRACGRP